MQLEGLPVQYDDLKSLALYNYGHFTSMRAERMRVRGLSMHLARLAHDSEQVFGKPIDADHARVIIRQAVQEAPDPVVARVTVFAPDFAMSQPARELKPTILVTTRPAPPVTQAPWRVKSVPYERDLPDVKHVGLFGQLYQRRRAQLEGFDDALFVDSNSTISEGPTWNVGFISSGTVIWPESDYLPGTTMRLVQDSLNRLDVKSRTVPVPVSAIPNMQSAFATNAAAGVRPISTIDDHDFAMDQVLLAGLTAAYWETPGEVL